MSIRAAKKVHVGKSVRLCLHDLNLDPAAIMTEANLAPRALDGDGTFISIQQFFKLWDSVEAATDDPALALTLAQPGSFDYFDPAFFAALCSPDFNTAVMRLSAFKEVVGPFLLDVYVSDATTRLSLRCKSNEALPQVLAMTQLIFLTNFLRRATRYQVKATAAYLPAPLPEVQAYEEHLGCAISEGPEVSVSFRAEDVKRGFLTHDEDLWQSFEPHLKTRIAESRADEPPKVSNHVERILAQALPSGQATMDKVAKELALSPRTLQRRLAAEGTSWIQVLNRLREEKAMHYLSQTTLSTAEISLLLGFEDTTSFFRAFKRWQGISPEAWRTAL